MFLDAEIEPPAKFLKACEEEWNPVGALPLHQWLTDSLNERDQLRLKCLGNVVYPKFAHYGLTVIESSLRSEGR